MTAPSPVGEPLRANTPGPVLAVDFGTTGTKAALRWPDGRTEALLFAGAAVLPSGVYAEETALLTGAEAQLKAFSQPARYEPHPKRFIEEVQVRLGARTVPVVELIAAILYQVWSAARLAAGNVPITVTLVHPAGWTRRSTDVLQEAAWRAGLPTPRLVSDPVAAACYAVEVQGVPVAVGASLVICDYGAGGFRATVVRRESTGYTVLAREDRPDSGGLDIDERLFAHLGASIVGTHPVEWRQLVEPETDTDRQAALLVRDLVMSTKETLSTGPDEINFSVPALSVRLPISRVQLESIIRPILDQTVAATRLAVRTAGLAEAALAAVFVVGAGGDLPQVTELLRERLGATPIRPRDGAVAMAIGAAQPTAAVLAAGAVAPGFGGIPHVPAPARPAEARGGPGASAPAGAGWSGAPRDAQGLPPTAPWAPIFAADEQPPGPTPPPWGQIPPVPVNPVDWRAAGFGAETLADSPTVVRPAPQVAPPVSGAPQSAAPYSAPPVSGAPQSAAPYSAPPVSGAPQPAPASGPPAGFGPSGGYSPPWLAGGLPAVPRSSDYAPSGGYPQVAQPTVTGPTQPPYPDYPPRQRPPARRGRGRLWAVLGGVVALLVVAGTLTWALWPQDSTQPTPTPAVVLPSEGPRGTGLVSYTTGDNLGPALVSGARHGGTLTVLDVTVLSHLDPTLASSPDERAAAQLIYRSLTAVRTNPDGSGTVIGDLATHPGLNVKGDCTVWRYTIRTGLKFQDGTEITAADVEHGIARSFDAAATGNTTLQRWLAGDGYTSRYDGVHAPGVTVPDAHTIVFTFDQPHCDMPYVASMPTTAPVPVSNPGGAGYDSAPVSSGPYQVASFGNKLLELVRNQNWQADSDPLRYGGPDKIRIQYGMNTSETVQRLAADSGDDQSAVSWTPNNRGDTGQAAATSSRDSTGVGNTPLYLAINMSTVADLQVRQAIAHAVDKQAVINTRGSTTWVSTALSSITDPAHLGYQSYPDPYPHDTDKARTLLAGKQLSLTLVIINNPSREKQAGAIAQALGAVGIAVTISKIGDPAGLRAALVKPETKWDLALIATGPSWPTAYRQLETMVDGRGGQFSTLNDAGINARLDELDKLPVDQQNAQAVVLDQKIMTELAPLVPIFFDQAHFIHGSRVSAVPLSTAYGLPDLATAYISTG